MSDEQLFDLINSYINGELSGKELVAFNNLIDEDSELKKRIELQRDITEAYKDIGRLKLRKTLSEILEEKDSSNQAKHIKNSKYSIWFLPLIILAALGTITLCINYFVIVSPQDQNNKKENPPIQIDSSGSNTNFDSLLHPPRNKVEDTIAVVIKSEEKSESPIQNENLAAIDEEKFTPNLSMEVLISSNFRSTGPKVSLKAPKPNIIYTEIPDSILFNGTISKVKDSKKYYLFIFNNTEVNNAILEGEFEVTDALDRGKDISLQISTKELSLGLYYFMIEDELGEAFWTGKFTLKK